LAYAARGWSIIPVVGKKSLGLWKPFQTSPADDNTLRRLFARKGITGLAVVLGRVSGGLAVRDFDDAGAYHTWAAQHPHEADTLPTVKTARGYHVYGRLDEDAFVTSADGELRADCGHYVVLPPSLHPDGPVYTWLVPLPGDGLPLSRLPASLLGSEGEGYRSTQEDPADPSILIACALNSLGDAVERAIARTLPTGPGTRNRRLFDLTREMKAVLPEARPDELRAVLREWHRRALPVIRTKDFDESWADLVTAWQRAEEPAGRSLEAAVARAEQEPAPPVAERYDGPLRRLVALCWQLQKQWGDRPFPLACRTAAEVLGVTRIKAWALLQALQFDRVLRRVRTGTKASKKASEWRFIAGQA
jgi:hypothetical protein